MTRRVTNIETTDACNLFCSACKTPHGTNFMSIKNFSIIAEKIKGKIDGVGLHWRGEPCLHPDLPELAQTAKKSGLKAWLSTNTAVPNLGKLDYVQRLFDNLDWVEICVDGYDRNTAARYRVGANWLTIENNLQTISKVETNCKKVMRVLMFKYNDGKEGVYRKMAKKYGMNDLIFAQPLIGLGEVISDEMAERWLSTERKYQRYRQKKGRWTRRIGKCLTRPIISVHGTVFPCCLDWELEHPIGNLLTENWDSITQAYNKIRPLLGRQEMCKLCCVPRHKVNFREKIK